MKRKCCFLKIGVSAAFMLCLLIFGCQDDDSILSDKAEKDLRFRSMDCSVHLTYEATSVTRFVPKNPKDKDNLSVSERALAWPEVKKKQVEVCVAQDGSFHAVLEMLPVDHASTDDVLGKPLSASFSEEHQLQRIEITNDDYTAYAVDGSVIKNGSAGLDLIDHFQATIQDVLNFEPMLDEHFEIVMEEIEKSGVTVKQTGNERYCLIEEIQEDGSIISTAIDKEMQTTCGFARLSADGEMISRRFIHYGGTPENPKLHRKSYRQRVNAPLSKEVPMVLSVETWFSNFELTKN